MMGFLKGILSKQQDKRAYTYNKRSKISSIKEAGNVFMMLFGAVGMVGVIGASTMTVMKGPVKTMSEVTKRTIAENNMIATGKLALIAAGTQANSDCDNDLTLEPYEPGASISGFSGGGSIPAAVGAAQQDPWGTVYGYCAWDHGTAIDDSTCGGSSQGRLQGSSSNDHYVLAIVSAGPDGSFDTSCIDYVNPSTPTIAKTSGSDDLILGYTYAEATAAAAGLWTLADPDTASTDKDLSVEDSTGTETFALDAETGQLDLSGGIPTVRTDFLQAFTNAAIDVSSPLTSDSDITTTADVDGVDITGSGAITGGSLISNSTLNVTGATTLAGTTVTSLNAGSGAITGGSITGSSLDVGSGTLEAGAATLGGTSVSSLSTGGTITLNGNSISNDGDTGEGISIDNDGNVTGSGNLIATGQLSGATLSTSGSATIGTTLGVTGQTTLAGLTAGTTTLGATSLTGTLDVSGNALTGLPAPTNANDAATMGYVDTAIAAGMSGAADDLGDHTATQNLDLANNKIINLANPTGASDAANKAYVDTEIANFSETDPQVGTLTSGRWCTSNGTTIDCNTAPPVGAGTTAGSLVDADNDTLVQVEESADDDTIRFDTAGSQRMVILPDGGVGIGSTNNANDSALFISKTHQNNDVSRSVNINSTNNPTLAPLTADFGTSAIDANIVGTFNEDIANDFLGTLRGGRFTVNHDDTNIGSDLAGVSYGVLGTSHQRGSGTVAQSYGGRFISRVLDNGGTITTSIGVDGTTDTRDNGVIDDGIGVNAVVRALDTGSSINNAYGVRSRVFTTDDGAGDGSITTGYALYGECQESNTCYGLYINATGGNVTAGQNWGIFVDGEDQNSLSGSLSIGSTVISSGDRDLELDVTGDIGADSYCDSNGNNCTTAAAIAAATGGNIDTLSDADGNTLIQVEEGADDNTIRFDTAGTERVTIDADGRIGIGMPAAAGTFIGINTIDDNDHALRIRGSATTASDILMGNAGVISAESSAIFNIDADNDSTDKSFIFGTNSATSATTELMRIQENGAVGIGDASPDATLKLDVEGQIGATEYCDEDGLNCSTPANIASVINGGNDILSDADNDTQIQVEEGADDDTIRFDTAGIERMTINSTGSVSIASNLGVTDGSINLNGNVGFRGLNIFSVLSGSNNAGAIWNEPYFEPSSAGTVMYGFLNNPRLRNSAMDITNFYAGFFRADTQASYTGDIENLYGIRIGANNVNGTGTVTNSYGVAINNMTGATNEYGVYQIGADDINYFAGNIGIGTTTPSNGSSSGGQTLKLDVAGAVGATHYCDEDGLNCSTAADLVAAVSGGTAGPAGADTQIQFNDGGSLAGTSALQYNTTTDAVMIDNSNNLATGKNGQSILMTGNSTSGDTYAQSIGVTSSSVNNYGQGMIIGGTATGRIWGQDITVNGAGSFNRGINLNVSNGTAQNWGISSQVTGSSPLNIGGYFAASGGTTNWPLYVDGDVGFATGSYLNFGTLTSTPGSTGYGFRDNAGTLEFKNSGGSWTAFGSGGGSDTLASLSCSSGQVAEWNGSAWICASNSGGGGGDDLGDHTATQGIVFFKVAGAAAPTK